MGCAKSCVENELRDIVPVGHGIHAVLRHGGKIQQLRCFFPVYGQSRACQRRGAQRENVDSFPAVGETLPIPQKHFDKSQKVVRQNDGLRLLQMRVARHDGRYFPLGHIQQLPEERFNGRIKTVDLVSQIQPDIQRDLVVAASGGVQLAPCLSNASDQFLLDGHVNVFVGRIENKRAFSNIRENLFQAADNRLRVTAGNNLLIGKHGRVRDRALYIISIQSRIIMERTGEGLHAASRGLRETSRPGFFRFRHGRHLRRISVFLLILSECAGAGR